LSVGFSIYSQHFSSFRGYCHAAAAASSKSTNDWPSGLYTGGTAGDENVSGLTVFNRYPVSLMLFWTSVIAFIAAGICVASLVMLA
jgi:hypothetical protein